ncbi:MAG: hypothetical protein PQJ46_14730, partial [Spirochaetales bacterium]|nr:hypothetical protein [Spirochaetales bacterium]
NYVKKKSLSEISKIPRSLTSKKVTNKAWEPNENSISILNHMTIDSFYIGSDQAIPGWMKYVNVNSLTIQNHNEKDIVYPRSVDRLEIDDCGLKEVPEIIGQLKPEWLTLYDNQITVIPQWVFEFPKRLSVSNNQIHTIEITKPCSITMLRIDNNNFSNLDFLHFFPELDFLVLSDNDINDFPVLESLSLQKLYLEDCQFQSIPDSINRLKNLTLLLMGGNPINIFPTFDLPLLDYFDISNTPVGDQYNVTDCFSSSAEILEFMAKSKSDGDENDFIGLCKMMESMDSTKIQQAFDLIKQGDGLKEQAEKRYLKFIQARLGTDADIFDFEKAALSKDQITLLTNMIVRDKGAINLSYQDDDATKLIVDFLGSIIDSVVDLLKLRSELSSCITEEELLEMGQIKISQIKTSASELAIVFNEGWFGKLMYTYTIFHPSVILFDHTSFYEANSSLRIEAFFVFLQCFAYDDCNYDVFQSEAPSLGELFWLLPNIPKIVWRDIKPAYPVSSLPFKRSAVLSYNNQSKQIKSKLI